MLNHCPSITACEPAPDLICSVCLDTWRDPVEMTKCGHIFCKACVAAAERCPECRGPAERQAPSRLLVRMAQQVKVRCEGCGWRGPREAADSHRCFAVPVQSSAARSVLHHEVTPEVVKNMATYFVAFGAAPHSSPSEVSLPKDAFFRLLRCFNYAEHNEDFEKIHKAALQLGGTASKRTNRVTVGGLMAFLAKYPADERRLYRLSVEQYHSCMFHLWQWFESDEHKAENDFSPDQFYDFSIKFGYLQGSLKSKTDRKNAIARWLPLVDVCDSDGRVSRHEMLRFMSSCQRGTSMLEENINEGLQLTVLEKQRSMNRLKEANKKSCCSMM